MKGNKILLFLAVILAFSGFATSYIGTAPGVQYVGELERGQTYESYFYVESDRSSSFIVEPEFSRPHSSLVSDGLGRNNLPFNSSEYSAEDISSWLSFGQTRFQVEPSTDRTISLDGGGSAVIDQRIPFTIQVPENAEPGYHARTVELNPQLTSSGSGGASVSTVALTEFLFYFKVPGDANRDMEVLGVNGLRSGDDQVRIDFLVENTGTVTTDIERMESTVYNQFGNQTGEVVVGAGRLAPGETRIAQTYWNSQDISAGEYRVEGNMGYLTGQAYIDSTINVSDIIQVEDAQQSTGDDQRQGVPPWLIIMALVLATALMYYLDIDPVIIILTVVALSASAFVLSSSIPNLVVGVIVALTALVFIYGW